MWRSVIWCGWWKTGKVAIEEMKAFLASLRISISVIALTIYFLGWPYSGQQRTATYKTASITDMNSNPSPNMTQLNQSELMAVNRRLRTANRAYLVFGGLALVFTALTLGASFVIYTVSNAKGDIEQKIGDQKDRDMAFLKAAGWNADVWIWTGGGAFSGVLVATGPDATPKMHDAADAIIKTLSDTALQAGKLDWPAERWNGFGGMLNGPPWPGGKEVEIRIVVGAKP